MIRWVIHKSVTKSIQLYHLLIIYSIYKQNVCCRSITLISFFGKRLLPIILALLVSSRTDRSVPLYNEVVNHLIIINHQNMAWLFVLKALGPNCGVYILVFSFTLIWPDFIITFFFFLKGWTKSILNLGLVYHFRIGFPSEY